VDQQDGGFEAFFRGSIQKINEQYAEFYEIYSFWNLTLAHSLRNSKVKNYIILANQRTSRASKQVVERNKKIKGSPAKR